MQALTVKNLKKTYSNGTKALFSIDFEVQEGDFFALLGSNGAGKSTAIGIISSLVNKTAGTVEVFGFDIDQQPNEVKRLIGLVPQEFNFNQWEPIAEIVINQAGFYGLSKAQAKQRAEICLKQMELWDKRHDIARTLSGGMKRRLMIARALVHQPKLLILDEPTAGVDIEIRQSMWQFIEQINQQGTTIILTTHYLEEAENLCRNIAIIDKGKIIENTAMNQLLANLDEETFLFDSVEPLPPLPHSSEYQLIKKEAQRFQATLKKGQSLNGLFSLLSEYQINVASMRTKQNRLEQLFMKLMATQDV